MALVISISACSASTPEASGENASNDSPGELIEQAGPFDDPSKLWIFSDADSDNYENEMFINVLNVQTQDYESFSIPPGYSWDVFGDGQPRVNADRTMIPESHPKDGIVHVLNFWTGETQAVDMREAANDFRFEVATFGTRFDATDPNILHVVRAADWTVWEVDVTDPASATKSSALTPDSDFFIWCDEWYNWDDEAGVAACSDRVHERNDKWYYPTFPQHELNALPELPDKGANTIHLDAAGGLTSFQVEDETNPIIRMYTAQPGALDWTQEDVKIPVGDYSSGLHSDWYLPPVGTTYFGLDYVAT